MTARKPEVAEPELTLRSFGHQNVPELHTTTAGTPGPARDHRVGESVTAHRVPTMSTNSTGELVLRGHLIGVQT